MRPAPLPLNENIRLNDLWSYGILDTQDEKEFDDLVELASEIYRCPNAFISFIDKDRQWLKSVKGSYAKEMPRDQSFCTHTVLEKDSLIIEDTKKDDRFINNPFVTGPHKVRFYAGVPIVSASGNNLGSVCITDQKPRKLTAQQAKALKIISQQITQLLELRMKNKVIQNQAEAIIAKEKKIAQATIAELEKERAHIGWELHENLAQSLAAIKLHLDYACESEEIREQFLDKSRQRLSIIINEIRDLSRSFVPTTLKNSGFTDAISDLLEQYEKETGWNTRFVHSNKLDQVVGDIGLAIFRVIQKQLKNIKQHAQAKKVLIKLQIKDMIVLEIKDNGVGIEMKEFKKGFGLNNIITRVEQFGGTVEIASAKNKGCTLTVKIPLVNQLN